MNVKVTVTKHENENYVQMTYHIGAFVLNHYTTENDILLQLCLDLNTDAITRQLTNNATMT